MVRFGPSGNDVKFYSEGNKTSVHAPKWLSKMGLSAYEVNFGRGIKMSSKMARELGEEARKHNIEISIHAPYYINLASADPVMVKKSYYYIEKCVEFLKIMGARRLVVHIGSQCGLSREVAMENCKKNIKWVVMNLLKEGYYDFLLCIETMGRFKAIGDYREICEICSVINPHLIPTLDFGHINCTELGALGRRLDRFREIIDHCERVLGTEKMKHVHIHFSAVKYGAKGELSHTTLDDDDWTIPFEPLARVIKDKKLEPVIICESKKIMAQDAVRLLNTWNSVNPVSRRKK